MGIEVAVNHMDLDKIANSGQCFRWEKTGERQYQIPAFGRVLKVCQPKKDILSFDCSEEEYQTIWNDYFDLSTDYDRYFKTIDPMDSFLTAVGEKADGVRILRQELWETIITFLISQNNNIPRIKKCIQALCREYEKFPDAHQICQGGIEKLERLKLGYRSSYLYEAALIAEKGGWESLPSMSYEMARNHLMKCKGIGPKVADCICLFSLHHIEAFPIDTWIRRVIESEYGGSFPMERYQGFAGVIQQFIFYGCISES